jgi:hypothetical protein
MIITIIAQLIESVSNVGQINDFPIKPQSNTQSFGLALASIPYADSRLASATAEASHIHRSTHI